MMVRMDTISSSASGPAPVKQTADQFADRRLDLLKRAGDDTSKVAVDPKASAAEQWRAVSEQLMPELHAEARAAGYSHVIDWLKAGADQHGKLPAAGARTAGAYTTPAEQLKREQDALKAKGLDAAAIEQKVHAQAEAYADERIKQMRELADKTGDEELTAIVHDTKAGPVEVWAKASKRLSELADKDGFSDPRVYLQRELHGAHAKDSQSQPAAKVDAGNSPAHTGAGQ
jgi:hypothetical protein